MFKARLEHLELQTEAQWECLKALMQARLGGVKYLRTQIFYLSRADLGYHHVLYLKMLKIPFCYRMPLRLLLMLGTQIKWIEGVPGPWWVTSRVSDTSGVHSSGDGPKCALKCRFSSHTDRNINVNSYSLRSRCGFCSCDEGSDEGAAGSLLLLRGPWAMPSWGT